METRTLRIEEIMQVLPHRYPMLMVDRILEVNAVEKSCRGLKNVSINEPFFQGHYPGKPIMPGVLILEAMAQVGCALVMTVPGFEELIPLIGAIDNVKFKRPVQPGDQLLMDVKIMWLRGTIGKMEGKATVDGELAASMELTFKLREKDRY